MEKHKLINEYNEMLQRLKTQPMFDGRDKGVDVYVCEKCGKELYTRYKDKGVTPFTIKCRHCDHGAMMHDQTISELVANFMAFEVHNWIRPSFEWLNNQRQRGNLGVVDHVLNGGLILEDEL